MLFQLYTLLATMAVSATATVCPGTSQKEKGAVWAVLTGASVNPWESKVSTHRFPQDDVCWARS